MQNEHTFPSTSLTRTIGFYLGNIGSFFSNRIDSCCRASLEEITQRHLTSLSYVLSTGSKVALPPSLCGVLWPVSLEDAPTSGRPTNNIIFLKLILASSFSYG